MAPYQKKTSPLPAPEAVRTKESRRLVPREARQDPLRDEGYPSAAAALSHPELRRLVAQAVRVAAGTGLLLATGCADPVCAPTRYEELTWHGEGAWEALSYSGFDGVETARGELALAVGLKTHPPYRPHALAGAMIAPMPLLEETGEAEDAQQSEEGAREDEKEDEKDADSVHSP